MVGRSISRPDLSGKGRRAGSSARIAEHHRDAGYLREVPRAIAEPGPPTMCACFDGRCRVLS